MTDGKLSEEAWDKARELYSQLEHANNGNDEAALAAALQELMDERDLHERRADGYSAACAESEARAEKAEARLAELVLEVRECVRTCGGNSALFAILDKYEGGEPARSERCKVCGASAPVYCDPDMPGVHSFEPGGEHG